jgi:hypothetical protein
MRRRLTRTLAVGGIGAALALSGAAPAMAGGYPCKDKCPCPPPKEKNCKPGYGFGDKNHCHFGPPGQGYSPSNPY